MAFSVIAIIPPPLPVAALIAAVDRMLDNMADLVEADFRTTTASWDHQPQFVVTRATAKRIITTGDSIYGMLNVGTKPHTIVARGRALVFQVPFKAKTAPRIIGSGGGGKGSQQIYTREVSHPGTEAREWDQAIAEKWQGLIGRYMQDAINAAVR